jgi:hypothetical protein
MYGVSFTSFAFSAFKPTGREFSQFWVVDSTSSINLTAFWSDFVSFVPPSDKSRANAVGFDVRGSGKVQIAVPLVSGQITPIIVHARYTPNMKARVAQRTGRLPSVSKMQSHSGCEFIFPIDPEIEPPHRYNRC